MTSPAVSTRTWAAMSKGQELLERHQGQMMTLVWIVNSFCIVWLLLARCLSRWGKEGNRGASEQKQTWLCP